MLLSRRDILILSVFNENSQKILKNQIMKLYQLIIAGLLLSAISCKKTVDGETERWMNSEARLTRLMTEYPNFEVALSKVLEESKVLFQSAASETNPELKIEKLGIANKAANPSFVNRLDNLDKQIENLRETSVKLFEMAETNKNIIVADVRADNVDSVIKDAKKYLAKVEVTDKRQANQALTKGLGKLDRLERNIKSQLSKAERAKRAAEQAANAAANADAANTTSDKDYVPEQ